MPALHRPTPRIPVLSRQPRGLFVTASILVAVTCRLDQLLVLPQGALLCVTPSLPDTLMDSAAGGSATQRSDTLSINNCGGGELRWRGFNRQGSTTASTARRSSSIPRAGTAWPRSRSRSTSIRVALRRSHDDSASATLTSADCGAPHPPGRYARIYSFPGTANDSVSIEAPASFDAYVVLDTALDSSHPPLAEANDCLSGSGDPCLYYQRLPLNRPYYVEVTSAAAADSGAFTLRWCTRSCRRRPRPSTSA